MHTNNACNGEMESNEAREPAGRNRNSRRQQTGEKPLTLVLIGFIRSNAGVIRIILGQKLGTLAGRLVRLVNH